MKRVLITGASGFIGHHLVQYLLEKTDWELVMLDRLDLSGNLNRLAEVITDEYKSRCKFVWHDLKSEINEYVGRDIGKVDHIIHLAASSHVDRSIEDPVSFAMDNVVGTTNLLNWARAKKVNCKTCINSSGTMSEGSYRPCFKCGGSGKCIVLGGMKMDIADAPVVGEFGVKSKEMELEYTGKFINFSTDEVFGPAELGHDHKEDEPHKPSNPYSASKSGQGAMGYAFYVTYGLPVITTYTMNNFGERQHAEKLIPKAIRSVLNGEEMPIFAEVVDGETKAVGSRFWLHSRNTASAILYILENGVIGESYNVVGFDEFTNLEICEKVAQYVNEFCQDRDTESDYKLIPKMVDFHKTRPGHDRRYSLDGTKLKNLGWTPEVGFEESLKQVVDFTIENKQWQ